MSVLEWPIVVRSGMAGLENSEFSKVGCVMGRGLDDDDTQAL